MLRTATAPVECTGAPKETIENNPKHVSTSFAERQNLTMRMHMPHFTRLTSGLSKKVRPTPTRSPPTSYITISRAPIRRCVTPAMAAGVTDKLWEIADIVARVEAKEAESRRRVAFTKRAAVDSVSEAGLN